MYKDSTSKLYHGFTQEHANSFFRIVSADLSIRKDASIYLPTLNDATNHPITNEIIDANLLAVFSRSHQNDRPGCPMPCTRKFPPTNEAMMVVPPIFKEWKQSQQHHQQHHITPPYLHNSIQPSTFLTNSNNNTRDDITAITFRADWDDDLEVSVIIEDNLSDNSAMDLVMKKGDVFDDLDVPMETIDEYKFLIQKMNKSRLTLKWERFKNLTINTLTRINNIDSDYLIILKRKSN